MLHGLCSYAGRLKQDKKRMDKVLAAKDKEITTLQENCAKLQEENRQLLMLDDCRDSAIGSLGDLSLTGGIMYPSYNQSE